MRGFYHQVEKIPENPESNQRILSASLQRPDKSTTLIKTGHRSVVAGEKIEVDRGKS